MNPEESKRQFLEEFLAQVARDSTLMKPEESSYAVQDLTAVTPDDYPPVEITEDIQRKIDEISAIARSIETRPALSEPSLPDKPFRIDYRRNLNPAQLAAVTTTEGPVLVIAGAGSGKTRVIVHRVSYLLELGVDPSDILLLTFTRKAAKEMLDRVQELLSDARVGKVMGGTFHSFANHILRKYSNLLGLPPNFTILDTGDSEDTIDLLRSEMKLDKTDKAFPKKNRIYEIISSARNRNKTVREIIQTDFSGLMKYARDIEMLFDGYTRYKKITGTFDYDDLMEILRNALRDHIPFRKKMQQEYRYIMVDEFQDTNILQKEIVDFLAAAHRNIMVVGDDAQSIYAFRGANYENILRFPQTYPDCRVIRIEQNYRSNQTILDFTNEIVKNARLGYRKNLFSANTRKFLPVIRKFYDQEEEAVFIVSKILELRERNISPGEIAVLTRAAWHWQFVEMELRKRNIPYVTVGGLAFHEKMHIKDMIAYLKVLLNPYDAIAWHRILKLLPGVGQVSATAIIRDIRQHDGKIPLGEYEKKKFFEPLKELMETLNRAAGEHLSVAARIQIIRDYYSPILASMESDAQVRMLDIHVLTEMAAKYEKLEKFLSDFTLEPPSRSFAGAPTPLIDESEDKPVTLSTIHSAKGLEWYAVFIPHALDGLLPSSRALKNLEEVEEERRLFYVACSRAREELYITMPSFVRSYQGFCSYPSRFLVEIDRNKYEYL
ncbi:MAG: ATP-dependent helicase [Bacteroidales bacterium]|nr:ATP-dependent helicase [Bacteroidales bacterium]